MNEKQMPRTGDAGDSEEARDDLRLASTEKTARTLAEKSPAAFSRPVPLKVGIFADLIAASDITPEALTALLLRWCGDARDIATISAGKSRVDLQGRKAGTITEQEESYAKMRAHEKFLSQRRG